MENRNKESISGASRFFKFLSYLSFQNAIRQIFFTGVLAGTIWLSIKLIGSISDDPRSGGTSDVLLFISSGLMSWLVSAWFSTFTSSDKIDTVAEQSFDKMRNATVQLGQVQLFLEHTVTKGRYFASIGENGQGVALMEHRMSGAIDMLKLISNSNEAVSSDWLGVVSAPVQRRLRDKMTELRRFTDVIDSPSVSDNDASDTFEGIPGAQRVVQSKKEASSDLGPAAIVKQTKVDGDAKRQSGSLVINVIRQTFYATGSGKFSQKMACVPSKNSVVLDSCPAGLDKAKVAFKIGVGTDFDFNINLRSTEYNSPLPLGDYVFNYEVESLNDSALS